MLRDLLRLDWRSDDRATEQATEQATEDGREPDWIKPAATNLWYLLATIYGTRGEDQELQAKNRLVWNRFMSKWLNPTQRKNLLDTGRYTEHELTGLNNDELDKIQQQLVERGANKQHILELSNARWLSVYRIKFDEDINFDDYIFTIRANFSDCYFCRYTNFIRATFFADADFGGAHFRMFTHFNEAEFFGKVEFGSAKFLYPEKSEFAGAIFHQRAGFQSTLFNGPMSFDNVKFHRTANFAGAQFTWDGSNFLEGPVSFVNSIFDNQTSFEGAEFRHFAPLFLALLNFVWARRRQD